MSARPRRDAMSGVAADPPPVAKTSASPPARRPRQFALALLLFAVWVLFLAAMATGLVGN